MEDSETHGSWHLPNNQTLYCLCICPCHCWLTEIPFSTTDTLAHRDRQACMQTDRQTEVFHALLHCEEVFLTESAPYSRNIISLWGPCATLNFPLICASMDSNVKESSTKITKTKETIERTDQLRKLLCPVGVLELSCWAPTCLFLWQNRAHNSHTSAQSRSPVNSL